MEEPACKPAPVRRPKAAGDHLSRRALARPTRRGSPAPCGYPGARAGRPRTLPARLAPDGGCRAAAVARRAGGLLPHRFTLTAARAPRRSAFCCPFARSPPPGSRQRPALWSPDFPRPPEGWPRPPGRLLRPRRYRSTALRGQPRVDPQVREPVGFGVPLPGDMFEPDLPEVRGEPPHLPIERLQVLRLDAIHARQLVDQQLAVRAQQYVGRSE